MWQGAKKSGVERSARKEMEGPGGRHVAWNQENTHVMERGEKRDCQGDIVMQVRADVRTGIGTRAGTGGIVKQCSQGQAT